ncbi:MAG: hypothetical protein ACOY9D_02720 [Pseudomonadota bacterium]
MLAGIFGKKSDHPMADIKSVQALLEDLPKDDVHKQLMELTEWMESVSDNTDFKPDHQFAVLRLLDEAAQTHVRKLSREYFTPNEPGKFQENRMWLVLGNLSSHTAAGYYKVFDRYCKAEKAGNALKAQLPLLLARTVNAMAVQLKFISVRYGHVDKTFWSNLAQIFSHAEQQDCLNAPVNLYTSMTGNTSVKFEIGHLLGWYGCGVNALKPLYMHLTERLVAQYCLDIDVHAQQGQQDLFSFDLNRPAAPKRVKVETSASPTTRYVNMTGVKSRLEALIKTLGKKVIPGELTIGVGYSPELMLEAAQYLLNYITSPPLRRNVRRSVKINMNVVQGFADTVERTNAGLNFNQQKPAQWQIEDISSNGFRTVLPAQVGDDIRVGSLLGVQPAGVQSWGVAVVRRMMRDDKNQLHVGAEMLTNQVTPVALVQGGEGGGAFEDGQTALWLYEKPGELDGGARLLMRAETFSSHRSLLSELNGEDYLLIPVKLLESCLDCDLAQFRLIKQEGSSAHI